MSDREKKKRPSVAGKRMASSSRPSASSQGKKAARAGLDLPEIDGAASRGAAAGSKVGQAASSSRASHAASSVAASASADGDAPGSDASRIAADSSAPSRTGTPRRDRSAARPARPTARKGRLSRRFVVVSLIVVAVLAVGCGLLAWNQWLRYDDAADIQGTWVIDGTDETITFTATDIVMTDEVSYPYTLDTFEKTIDFSFKQYSGAGSYAFSPERTTLIITETDADTGSDVSTKLVKQ